MVRDYNDKEIEIGDRVVIGYHIGDWRTDIGFHIGKVVNITKKGNVTIQDEKGKKYFSRIPKRVVVINA